ncbi:MAG: response regulator [Candidatus Bipolaricaulia bacterium]
MNTDTDLNVLVVDDDEAMTETLSDILGGQGYSVAIAHSGEQAISQVSAKAFDCILLDIKMSGMNGVEAFKAIKQVVPKAVVVMMTAYTFHELIEEAKREGVLKVLTKPIDIRWLMTFLQDLKTKITNRRDGDHGDTFKPGKTGDLDR